MIEKLKDGRNELEQSLIEMEKMIAENLRDAYAEFC